MSKSGKDFLWCLLAALLFVFVKGYWFNCADQEEHLPQVYKLIDSSLYKGDYFVEPASTNFTIRFFYVYTVYFFSILFSVSVAVFILHLVCIALTAYFIKKISEQLFSNEISNLLAPFFVLIIFNEWTVGGNNFEDIQLTCTVFANVGCMAAIYFFIAKKYFFAALSCGLAALFQVLMGLHIEIILLACLLFSSDKNKIKSFFVMLFSFLVFASPMLIPIITKQLSTSAQADKNLFYYALYVFRNSNHYFPSFFPAINYYKSALILLLSAGLILFYSHPQKKTLLLFFGVIVFGMFCFWLVFEKFKIYESGKLQWFKTSTWLTAMCAIIISGYLGKMFGSFFQVNKKIIYTVVIWCVLLFIAITNSAFLPSKKLKSKFRIGNYQKSDLTLMHEWIKQNTPVDALMLSFPGDDSFLCEAQRPMPVAFKAIIHEPWFMNKWYDDFKSFYSLNDSINFYSKNAIELASKSFRKTDNSEFLKQKGIKYRLINLAELDYQIQENKIIHKQGNYVLEQL